MVLYSIRIINLKYLVYKLKTLLIFIYTSTKLLDKHILFIYINFIYQKLQISFIKSYK